MMEPTSINTENIQNQGIGDESTPSSPQHTPVEVKASGEHISSISEPESNKMLPGSTSNSKYSARAVSNPVSSIPVQPNSTERFDFLDFGDPTFASAGFLAPRRDSHPDAASPQQSISPFATKSPAWQTQQTLVSVHGAGCADDRAPTDCKLDSSLPRSSLAGVNHSDFNVSRLPSSTEVSPVHHHRLPESPSHNQTHQQAVNQGPYQGNRNASAPAHGLVLEDFAVEYRDPRSPSSLASLSNRFSGTASRIGTDLSNRTRLDAGSAVVPHNVSARGRGYESDVMFDPNVSQRTKDGQFENFRSAPSIHEGKLSPDESYDLEFDDFFPEERDFVTSDGVALARNRLSPESIMAAVLVSPSSPTPRAPEVRPTPTGVNTDRREIQTAGGADRVGTSLFSDSSERGASQHARSGERGQENQHSPDSALYFSPSPSHSHTPYQTTPSRESGALSPRAHIPDNLSPHFPSSHIALAGPTPTNPSSDRSQAERHALTCTQNPPLPDAYSTRSTGTHDRLDPSTGTETCCRSVEREGEVLAASPRSGRMVRQNGRTSNGQVQSSSRQPRNTSRLWQRKSHHAEFSPLPTVSSSTEEEEEEEDYYDSEGIEMLEKGQTRSDGSKGRRRQSRALRHCHQPKMANLTDPLARRQLVAVVVLCVFFMAGEAVGGVLANSLALFTDVLHLGSDLVSFIISLLAMWLANKPPTRRMSFGYHRAEVLGALLSVFIIWLVSGVLCYIAVERIVHEHYKNVRPNEMLITASLGVVINFIMGFVLHSEICCGHAHSHNKFGHGHSHGGHDNHSHSHNHGATTLSENNHSGASTAAINSGYDCADDKGLLDVRSQSVSSEDAFLPVAGHHGNHAGGREGLGYQTLDENTELSSVLAHENHYEKEKPQTQQKNINVRAAFIHVVGDIIQSIGVLVAALIIKFNDDPKFRLADPICTFLFSLIVLITTLAVLRDTLLVMMEAVPRNLSVDTIRKDLLAVDGVVAVHSMHVWALTMDRNAISVHLAIGKSYFHDQVLSSALAVTQDHHRFFSSTIQVEQFDESRSQDCTECLEVK